MQRSERLKTAPAALPAAILAGALLGALLLIVAEFTTLFTVRDALRAVRSFSTGSNHSYGLIPIALAAAAMGVAFYTAGSRPALLALGVLGIVALLIGLIGDLPHTHERVLVGSGARGYISATTSASTGMYMETLGAVLLLLTCGLGFLLLGPPARRTAPGRAASPPRSAS